ncbi:hypothetical protein HanXRQr2_Chr16g0734831 [Helianthus annuus]|uniref:Uncharacterized protein n=1 Tax=Helianthus annuus TaxID=4232 RepID=A0A9K3GX73_HELAN|nr:hypothetical protein HanXRQr2_Chr16g0734831 [Helianthus annuus]
MSKNILQILIRSKNNCSIVCFASQKNERLFTTLYITIYFYRRYDISQLF